MHHAKIDGVVPRIGHLRLPSFPECCSCPQQAELRIDGLLIGIDRSAHQLLEGDRPSEASRFKGRIGERDIARGLPAIDLRRRPATDAFTQLEDVLVAELPIRPAA